MARRGGAQKFSQDVMSVSFDGDFSAQLKAYGDKVKATFKEASFKAATVLYDEMKLRVPKGETKNLLNSIYRFRLKNTPDTEATFMVGVNVTKAPHWHFTELGTRKQAAKPYIRPTRDAKLGAAAQAAIQSIKERLANG